MAPERAAPFLASLSRSALPPAWRDYLDTLQCGGVTVSSLRSAREVPDALDAEASADVLCVTRGRSGERHTLYRSGWPAFTRATDPLGKGTEALEETLAHLADVHDVRDPARTPSRVRRRGSSARPAGARVPALAARRRRLLRGVAGAAAFPRRAASSAGPHPLHRTDRLRGGVRGRRPRPAQCAHPYRCPEGRRGGRRARANAARERRRAPPRTPRVRPPRSRSSRLGGRRAPRLPPPCCASSAAC